MLVTAPIRLCASRRLGAGILYTAPAEVRLKPARISSVHISVAVKIATAGIECITGSVEQAPAEIELED